MQSIKGTYNDSDKINLGGTIKMRNKSKNADVATGNNMVPINMLPITIFNHIQVKCNNTELTESTAANHAYKAHLDTLFSYSRDAKEEKLAETCFWYNETVGSAKDTAKEAHDGSSFLKKHTDFTAKGGVLHFRTQLHLDIFNTHKYYPGDLNFEITFTTNTPNFCLITAGCNTNEYEFEFDNLELWYNTITASPSKWSEHEAAYTKGLSAMIPVSQTQITHRLVNDGASQVYLPNVCLGSYLPSKVFVAMVEHSAWSGDRGQNPFVYKHFDIQSIQLQTEERIFPDTRYEMNWEAGTGLLAPYSDLMQAIGVGDDNASANYSFSKFKDHSTIFVMGRQPDSCCNAHTHLPGTGQVSLELIFRKPLPRTISVLIYASYDKVVTFKREKQLDPPIVDIVYNG